MSAREKFVKGSGVFGKYLYRGAVYFGENAIAFLGLTLTIVALFSVSHILGLTVPMMAATASAAVASLAALPVLAGIVALAVAIAAPETLKKVYKESTEWVVAAYKNAMKNWFMPKDFSVSIDKAKTKDAKENTKHARREDEDEQKHADRLGVDREVKYKAIYQGKTADLDLAGMRGKKAFKNIANGIADGVEWVANGPSYMASCLPSFSRSKAAANDSSNSKAESLLSPQEVPKRSISPTLV